MRQVRVNPQYVRVTSSQHVIMSIFAGSVEVTAHYRDPRCLMMHDVVKADSMGEDEVVLTRRMMTILYADFTARGPPGLTARL